MPASDSIIRACELLQASQYGVALTGAGVSTPSGIPDFRSPNSGVWEKVNSMEVASLFAFRRKPEAFYDWLRPMVDLTQSAVPNPAHQALAKLEEIGKIKAVITQNIDGLHRRAGSQNLIEIHGNFQTASCIQCYQTTPGEQVLRFLSEQEGVPTCPACGGVLKPDVILFGEQLPVDAVHAASQAAHDCDLMLVAGSSLTIEPAASLPVIAKQRGASLIIVNYQNTLLDYLADVVINEDVAVILPQLAEFSTQSL